MAPDCSKYGDHLMGQYHGVKRHHGQNKACALSLIKLNPVTLNSHIFFWTSGQMEHGQKGK